MIVEGYYSCKKLFSKDFIVPLNEKCYSANVAIVPINGIMQEIGGDKMCLEDLKEHYKKEIGIINSSEEFFNRDEYNPWSEKKVRDLIMEFENALNDDSKDFSWLNVEEGLSGLESKKLENIHYGIPNHIKGNIDDARLFLCLVNPNIALKDKKYKIGIKSYFIEAEKEAGGDSSLKIIDKNSDREEFITKHIVDCGEESSILYQELSKLKENNSLEGEYYFSHYFAHICFEYLGKRKVSLNKLPEKLSEEEWKKLLDMSKLIANLEAFPFRSKNPGFTKGNSTSFANEIVKSKSKVGMLSARLIIWRIVKYLNEKSNQKNENELEPVKPVFIFRRFNTAWLQSIMNVLMFDLKFNKNQSKKIIEELHENFFYTIRTQDFDGQSGYVGKNICKNNERLDDDDFRILCVETFK